MARQFTHKLRLLFFLAAMFGGRVALAATPGIGAAGTCPTCHPGARGDPDMNSGCPLLGCNSAGEFCCYDAPQKIE